MRWKIFLAVCFLQVAAVNALARPVPFDSLQIWLIAESVDSTSDFFLATMPNKANTRYAVNQVKIEHRPLYIKDYIEHRPVVSLSDTRGFAFGTLRATTETAVYIGYYHEVHGEQTRFKIAKFNPDDILAKDPKDGFVVGIYDGMLAIHGRPGYTAAFTEMLLYTEKLTDQEDERIRGYLKSRYSLRNDERFIKSNPAIALQSLIGISNTPVLANKNIICAAAKVDDPLRGRDKSVEILKSYNDGQKWSETIITVLDEERVSEGIKPLLYSNSEDTIFFFYNVKTSGGSQIACKYSNDEGYNWSGRKMIEKAKSRNGMYVKNYIHWDNNTVFAVCREGASGLLLYSPDIVVSRDDKITWKSRELAGVFEGEEAVKDNFTITEFGGKLHLFYNTTAGYVLHRSLDQLEGKWSEASKVSAGGFPLLNDHQVQLHTVSVKDGVILFFGNGLDLPESRSQIYWFSLGLAKGGVFEWQCPQIALYSYDYSGNPEMNISSVVDVGDSLFCSVLSSDAAYFCGFNPSSLSRIIPEGVGVLELKDDYDQKEEYFIPDMPSLLTAGVIADISLKSDMLQEDRMIFKFGGDDKKLIFFTENRRYCVFVKDGEQTALCKSTRFKKPAAHNIMMELDGEAGIIRLTVDGHMTGLRKESPGWAYMPEKLEKFSEPGKLFFSAGVHKYIKTFSLHYVDTE